MQNSCQKTINLICAGNKVFVKYQAQGGGLTPTPTTLAFRIQNIITEGANMSEIKTLLPKEQTCSLAQTDKLYCEL